MTTYPSDVCSVHKFSDLETAPFPPRLYSQLKFGSDAAAHILGNRLAQELFDQHQTTLLTTPCVVIPSPYNHVKNAASIMTKYVVAKLNQLLVGANGHHVETSIVHRHVTYTMDYGRVDANARESLLAQDRFFLNWMFLHGKTIIFVDDVKITGTHERRMKQELGAAGATNKVIFAYFAEYTGDVASTEAELNFSGVRNIHDYVDLCNHDDHHVIVRSIKMVLGTDCDTLAHILPLIPRHILVQIRNGALGEGYYAIPSFQPQLRMIMSLLDAAEESQ